MNSNISNHNTVTGANMLLVLLAVLILGGVCILGYSLRWIEWCNMAESPYIDAVKNIAALMVSALVISLMAKDSVKVRRLWEVPLLYLVFFSILPTAMFFKDYLVANMILSVAMYCVWNIDGDNAKMYIFLASWAVGIAMWWVGASVVFLLMVYVGVMVYAPQDIRNWILPVVGLTSSMVLAVTYHSVLAGDIVLPEQYSWEAMTSMPYTDKVFKAQNMYFYAAVCAVLMILAYIKYIARASNDTLHEKKLSILISALAVVAVLAMVMVPDAKYMLVFSSMPFALILAKFFMGDTSRYTKMIFKWAVIIIAAVSMWTFK